MFLCSTWAVIYIPSWVLFAAGAVLNIVSTSLAIHLYRKDLSKQDRTKSARLMSITSENRDKYKK